MSRGGVDLRRRWAADRLRLALEISHNVVYETLGQPGSGLVRGDVSFGFLAVERHSRDILDFLHPSTIHSLGQKPTWRDARWEGCWQLGLDWAYARGASRTARCAPQRDMEVEHPNTEANE